MGIILGTILSAVADNTGDDSADAITKLTRLVNTHGPSFCNIADWKFLREQITMSISSAASKYSGSSYLPSTYKETLAAYLKDGDDHYPFIEVGAQEAYDWINPDDNDGRPDEFLVSRLDDNGFYELQLNRLPDNDYSLVFEIEKQWTSVTLTTAETIITEELEGAFVHYITMKRLMQQGDTEQYTLYKDDWYNPSKPEDSILTNALKTLRKKTGSDSVIMSPEYLGVQIQTDYSIEVS